MTQASKLHSSKELQEHSESENEHQKGHLIKLEAQESKGERTASLEKATGQSVPQGKSWISIKQEG